MKCVLELRLGLVTRSTAGNDRMMLALNFILVIPRELIKPDLFKFLMLVVDQISL